MDKKTIIIIGSSTIGVIILILAIIWLISIFKPTYITYEQLESKMKSAAKNYYQDHLETLPSDDGTYSLDYSILSNDGYLKPINEYIKNNNNCSANITVIKNGTDYTFIPYLNCGEEYTTMELYKKVLENNEVVVSENGLYQDSNGEYYFRGKVENNYVALGTKTISKKETPLLWKIISINNGTIKLRSVNKYSEKAIWDNRYNEKESSSVGYNDFETSEIKDFLKNIENDEELESNNYKSLLLSKNICVGGRSIDDSTSDGSTDCSVLSKETYYYSTITPYEFMRASLDPNCNSTSSRSCSNLNYLASDDQSAEWTTIKDSTSDFKIYSFDGEEFSLKKANQTKSFYPVIVLNNYAFYSSGNGTIEDPYMIKLVSE